MAQREERGTVFYISNKCQQLKSGFNSQLSIFHKNKGWIVSWVTHRRAGRARQLSVL